MEYPKVSIIILNWNGLEDTIECLESLKKITYPNFEVIVADNGSKGKDVDILREKYGSYIHIIENHKNLGFAEGNNIGMKYVLEKGTDYILLLNNDTVVDSRFLDELMKIGGFDSGIGIVGPKVYYMEHPDVLWSAGGKINWYIGHWQRGDNKVDRGQFDEVEKVDFISGACMLIKKEVIEKIGFLSTEYFLGWEDIDYCTQAKREDFKCIYAPKAKIWHKVSASFERGKMNYAQVTLGFRNRIIFRRKFLSNPRFVCFTICFILIVMPIHLIYYLIYYRDFHRVNSFLKGVKEGFKEVLKGR